MSTIGRYFLAKLLLSPLPRNGGQLYSMAGNRPREEQLTQSGDEETGQSVRELRDMFDCSDVQAAGILDKNPDLPQKIPHLSRLVAAWKRMGLSPQELLKNEQVFSASGYELTERTNFLEVWQSNDLEASADLRYVDTEDVKKYTELVRNHADKIRQFATLLACSNVESCKLFSKYSLLAKSKPTTLKKKIDTLIEGGIEREDLVKDLWIMTYTEGRLRERLQLARRLQLTPIKPWMLRCNKRTIQRTWSNREENRAAMAPLTNTKDYLCQRLGMTEQELESFSSRHPPVMRVQVTKLKEVIDFLLSEGFTPTQIYNTPRILCHSLNTIRERLGKLRERKYKPYTLSVLCKSENYFSNFLQKVAPFSAKV